MKNSFVIWNSLVLLYIGLAYGFGIWSIAQPPWLLNSIGVVLIIHALLISAIMTHEFIHGTIFRERSLNELFGKLMTHINGACYIPDHRIAQNHIHHHIWHVDLVPFDYGMFVKNLPPFVRKTCVALEWCYFPIFEFILRWRYIVTPLNKTEERWRVLACLAYRGTLFSILALISVKALILYCVAYIGFIMVLRLVDTFHHTYEYWIADTKPPRRDRVYEQANTFSNVVSAGRFRWLNLIYLNFGYHNAHHHDMRCPWYKLPELHEHLYGSEAKNLLPFSKLVRNYHRFRVARLLGSTQGDVSSTNTESLTNFAGAVGLSFLTPP